MSPAHFIGNLLLPFSSLSPPPPPPLFPLGVCADEQRDNLEPRDMSERERHRGEKAWEGQGGEKKSRQRIYFSSGPTHRFKPKRARPNVNIWIWVRLDVT